MTEINLPSIFVLFDCSMRRNGKHMTENTRIVIDPQICHGSPCVRGLRYPVTMILELLASGMSHSEILADYADLEEDDIRACLQYAARLSDVKSLVRTIQ